MTLDQLILMLTSLRTKYPGITPMYVSVNGSGSDFHALHTDFCIVIDKNAGNISYFNNEVQNDHNRLGIAFFPA